MAELLTFAGVTKNYGNFTALGGVNLIVPRGKIIGLLGPNGSGKTTILKLMNGLLQPTAGKILVNGEPIGIQSRKVISYLPEQTYLNNWMSVCQLLDFFGDFYEDFERGTAEKMLETLGVDSSARLKTLSKGTKEKVQLVLVMSRAAELYLLDEPIGGVDPATRDYILNTIIGNYRENSSVIISTHLIQDVEQIFDEVIFLSKGRITLAGNVDDIRAEHEKSIDELFREVFKC